MLQHQHVHLSKTGFLRCLQVLADSYNTIHTCTVQNFCPVVSFLQPADDLPPSSATTLKPKIICSRRGHCTCVHVYHMKTSAIANLWYMLEGRNQERKEFVWAVFVQSINSFSPQQTSSAASPSVKSTSVWTIPAFFCALSVGTCWIITSQECCNWLWWSFFISEEHCVCRRSC